MTAKHTPIPWTAAKDTFGNWRLWDKGGNDLLGQMGSDEEEAANALYAVRAVNCHAALLEALQELAQYAASEIDVPLTECVSGPIGKARAAIAKATQPTETNP